MKYVIYDSSGDITAQIDCPEDEITNYIFDGLDYLEFSESAINKVVVGGEVVDKETHNRQLNVPSVSIRQYRNALLAQSDWTQMPDAQLTDAKKAEWITYRQALRDIPETYSDATSLDDIIWPTKPE
jgi:hypothetical protein